MELPRSVCLRNPVFKLAPAPRENETLYSVLARLGHYLNAADAGPLMEGLMGRRSAIASSDLPGGLSSLVRDIVADQREAAIDRMIDRLTAFPFYTAFTPAEVRNTVRHAMRSDVTGIYTRLGLAAFKLRPPSHLRFCLACLEDMETQYRDLWWRREHQLPGVLVCPKHGVALRLSSIDPGSSRHSFVAASRAVCRSDALPEVAGEGDTAISLLHDLAQRAAALLDIAPAAISHDERVRRYRERLADVGLMRSAKRLDVAKLHLAFRDRWANLPELIPGLNLSDDTECSWLTAMLRTGRRASHPVQHLLLGAMLDDLANVPVERPFGAGPWTCRNPLAEHSGQKVIGTVIQRRDGSVVYGDFVCSCGYLYTVARNADGTYGRPRYRRFGPLLAPTLVEAVAQGKSLRATARVLGLDPKTLMREAAIAGVSVPWTLQPSGAVPKPRPTITVPCAPTLAARSRPRRRRNWFAIDHRLAHLVATSAVAVIAELPPVRVTFAEIERRIARRGWIVKRKDKLPRTISALDAVSEDVDAFRLRRLNACVGNAVASGDLRPCEIMRKAGLTSSWLPRVRESVWLAQSNRWAAG